MTRINLIEVKDLADQHLFAEWREIKMIPARVRKLLDTNFASALVERVPSQYTMSTGHVRFFYNKLGFLYDRYLELTTELRKREFNISETNPMEIFLEDFPWTLCQIWTPSVNEKKVNIDRVVTRLNERPEWYRYYGKVVQPSFFIERYDQQLLVDILQ